jgi:hypothetical protein
MTTQTLSTFKIGIIGPNESYSDQLYANGNQQMSVFIYVSKQEFDPATGSWKAVLLTPSEQSSLTVVQYSSSVDASLPPGWSCDSTKNQFDQGLRGSSYQAYQQDIEADAGAKAQWESYTRYLRAGTSVVPLQGYQFMARIRLDDGKVYTTHYSDADHDFESKITVTPQRPYIIQVAELVCKREDPFHQDYDKEPLDVDTYYWTLPSSLRILGEEFSGEGLSSSKLAYAYVRNEGSLRVGAAIKFTVTSLTLGDIGYMPSSVSGSTPVTIINSPYTMRGLRYYYDWYDGAGKPPTFNNNMYWTVIDNLGCRSRFILRANSDDKGNTLDLIQG